MSNAGHTSLGSLRPGYTALPDGRSRYVATKVLSIGDELRTDLAKPWGSTLAELERIETTEPRQAFLADLRLVEGQSAQQTQGGGVWVWQRIYETQSATGETQIGGARLVNDADGREQIELTFRQFVATTAGVAIPYVRGTKGSLAPGYPNTALASEEMTDNGAWRTITRRYDQTNADAATADALGPVIIRYPFNAVGDPVHCVAAQTFEQPASSYAPLALNATRTLTVAGAPKTLYYVGDRVPPGRQGATLARFVREWADVPATRYEYQEVAYSFPGLRSTQAELNAYLALNWRVGFTERVNAQVELRFYRVGSGTAYTSEADIPRVAKTKWSWAANFVGASVSPLAIFLSDVNFLYYFGGSYNNLLTVPTRSAYEALVTADAFNLVVDCEVDRYLGNIFVRRTVRVKAI